MDETRYLGLDIGKKRVGVAISDPLGVFAQGLTTLVVSSKADTLKQLNDLCQQHPIGALVVGLPIKTTGEASELSEFTQTIGNALAAQLGIPIYFEDERFTSKIAQQSLQAQGVKPSRNKGLIDQTAAAIILQGFLDKQTH